MNRMPRRPLPLDCLRWQSTVDVVTGTLADGTLGRLLDGTLDHLNLRSVFAIPLLVQQLGT